jgi:hypothetical protein
MFPFIYHLDFSSSLPSISPASADDASKRVIYKCGEWETNELMKKFEFALRNPYKVGTPVFALVVNADLQCWEYARIVKVHATDPRDPSIENLTYEVNLEKQNTPIFCNHEQVAPMRVRMTASEYSTMMDMDTEETFCIKKMNAQEVKTAKDSWWIGVVPLYWHEHSKHLTVMRVTDAGRYRHPFLTVAYNPVDKDRTYRVHVASQSLEEFCREQGQLQLRDHHTFGIGLEYYFHTDHDKHLWQEVCLSDSDLLAR